MRDEFVIVHSEDFEEILHKMSDDEVGKIIKNMIRAFTGEEVEIFNDRYLDLMTSKLCGRVIREKEISEKRSKIGALGGAVSKPKAKGKQKVSKTKANDKQTVSSNTNTNTNTNTIKNIYGVRENVLLTEEEHKKVIDAGLEELIDELSLYIDSKGAKYKSHYSTILAWARRRDKGKVKTFTPKTNNFTQIAKRDYDLDELEKRLIKN